MNSSFRYRTLMSYNQNKSLEPYKKTASVVEQYTSISPPRKPCLSLYKSFLPSSLPSTSSSSNTKNCSLYGTALRKN